jgi:hypothetical protein
VSPAPHLCFATHARRVLCALVAQPAGDAPATRLAAGSLIALGTNVVQVVKVR